MLGRLNEAALVRYVSPLERALCYAGLGRLEETFASLEAAFGDRVSDLVRLRVLP